KAVGGESLLLADADAAKATALADQLGAAVSTNEQIAKICDYIILGIKPQLMGAVLPGLREQIPFDHVVVSMAAGVSINALKELLGVERPTIRIMPNTPVQVGEGRILYAMKDVKKHQEQGFLELFSKAGKLFLLEEKLIDAGTALSGCGPAFAYLFIEALADGAVTCGLPRETALELAAGTVLGSAKTVLETGIHPGALKDAVCSPGGSTIEGVHALEQNGFRGAAMEAVIRAYEKTKELGRT
ncbi:MAG: pyrroline-5-carboxylate reductase, partial [Clostridia bacterium]|nr:pyrroline-5-carboxylate reductase [Clostridia bacterium]